MGEWTELMYAKQLATNLWKKHYKESSPDWEPLDDLMGVLTQIDNMTCGLHSPKEQPQCDTCTYRTEHPHEGIWCYMFESEMPNCKKYLAQGEQRDFPGPDDILKMRGREPLTEIDPTRPYLKITKERGMQLFPATQPTRGEWEAWIESFVDFSGFGLSRGGMATLMKIMLAMPGVPKE